jgi:hypothetical protein
MYIRFSLRHGLTRGTGSERCQLPTARRRFEPRKQSHLRPSGLAGVREAAADPLPVVWHPNPQAGRCGRAPRARQQEPRGKGRRSGHPGPAVDHLRTSRLTARPPAAGAPAPRPDHAVHGRQDRPSPLAVASPRKFRDRAAASVETRAHGLAASWELHSRARPGFTAEVSSEVIKWKTQEVPQ